MKINLLGKQINDLDGRPLPGGMMNVIVSELLANVRGGGHDPVKLYELAGKLRKGEVDIDTADIDLVERIVRENDSYPVLGKGQILLELGEQRRAAK